MSQAQLLPASQVSLPPITYKGQPVITTESLARSYECEPKQIRQNFANNKARFIEGKHYFIITNGELKTFRDYVENFDVVIPARTRHFTLWTERGSLLHAKSIGTDQAWYVYDILVETFFRVVKPEPEAPVLESTATPSTPADRAPLRALVYAWSQAAGLPINSCWPQVKAHFQLSRIDDLPVEWIPDALAFVQSKIDGLPKALPESDNDFFLPVPDGRPIRGSIQAIAYKMRMHMYNAGAQSRELERIWKDYARMNRDGFGIADPYTAERFRISAELSRANRALFHTYDSICQAIAYNTEALKVLAEELR